MLQSISKNIISVENRIKNVVTQNGMLHRVSYPKLIAVSKKQPEEKIDECLASGQRVFGENRVQEAQKRWKHLLLQEQKATSG